MFCLVGNSCACRRRLPDGKVTQACGLLKGGLFTPIGADRFAVKLAGSALHPQDTARKRQEGARRGRSRENRAHFCPDKEGAQTIPVYCRAPDAVRAESRRLSPLIAVSLPYFPLTHINASLRLAYLGRVTRQSRAARRRGGSAKLCFA